MFAVVLCAVPNVDVVAGSLKFLFEVMEPLGAIRAMRPTHVSSLSPRCLREWARGSHRRASPYRFTQTLSVPCAAPVVSWKMSRTAVQKKSRAPARLLSRAIWEISRRAMRRAAKQFVQVPGGSYYLSPCSSSPSFLYLPMPANLSKLVNVCPGLKKGPNVSVPTAQKFL